MDEFFYRLSDRFDTLQIQASMTNDQSHRILNKWLSHSREFLHNVKEHLDAQEIKEYFARFFSWIHKQVESVANHLPSIDLNLKHIYHELKHLYVLKVSQREFLFLLIGLLSGTIISYMMISKCTPHDVHHIKGIVCQYYEGIQGAMFVDDVEMPKINNANEVLIQVKATSINEIDIKICSGYSKAYRRLLNSGKYKNLPVILGRDCAGVIVGIGRAVINFDIGDKVYLAVPSWSHGTMAEFIVVPETQIAKMPNLSFEESATLAYNGCLAWDALINSSLMKAADVQGKRVLIFGGNNCVACILLQLIKLWGGYVVTVCTEDSHFIKTLGADEIYEFNHPKIYKDLNLQDKFDIIFYFDGPYMADESLLKSCLSLKGSYISMVPEYLSSDSFGYINETLFSACLRIRLMFQYMFGTSLYDWKDGSKLKAAYLNSLQELVNSGQLRPIAGKVYPPNRIDRALFHTLSYDTIGSTVIRFK